MSQLSKPEIVEVFRSLSAFSTTRGRISSTAVQRSFPTAETEKPSVLSFLSVKTVGGFQFDSFCSVSVSDRKQERFMTLSPQGGAMGGGELILYWNFRLWC